MVGFLPTQLQGSMCQSPNTCTAINYPVYSIPAGVTELNNDIKKSTSNPINPTTIVYGYSQGAQVAEQWVKKYANDPTAPSPDNLTFVLLANETRAYGGSLVEPAKALGLNPALVEMWPQSQYQVIDVARQYEGTADYPNNPSSRYYWLAVMNSTAGVFLLHGDYSDIDLNDPANAVYTEGNITYVTVPTQNLPMLEGLRTIGLTDLADSLNAQLKPQVEQAYNRPAPFPTTTQSTSSLTNATVAPENTSAPAPTRTTAPLKTNGSVTGLAKAETAPSTPSSNYVDRLAAAAEKAIGAADQGVATARRLVSTVKPTGATDLTGGNLVKPNRLATNSTKHTSTAPDGAGEQVTENATPPDDGNAG
ncbi:PE-PPE domain-containing protein [Mycobacterium hodleri]|uniref:PE-PPE domain-containing protein n=1 Tax=Mycolicibacterium hodleri TaxID=49897 RepID=A0A502EDK6_9MYCO|nr:PE-PPE domain-containing protein [Mycolicibacterium hodleri]